MGLSRFLPGKLTSALLVCAAAALLPVRTLADGKAGPEGGIRFLVLGDWGRGGERLQREVAQRMGTAAAAGGADFVISVGDNFYDTGVRSVDDEAWETSFRNVYTAPSLDIPWYAVLGNHDYRGRTTAQIAYTSRDERWKMPDRFYSIEMQAAEEKVLFVFLDTSPFIREYRWLWWRYPDLSSQDFRAQLRWLEDTLARSSAAWKIVVGHHPVFSGGKYHGQTAALRQHLRPVLEKYGVRVYFSGHEHSLQHLRPPGPTHYVISGAGSRARPASPTADTLFSRSVPGFAAVSLKDKVLHLEFIDHQGTIIYRARLQASR